MSEKKAFEAEQAKVRLDNHLHELEQLKERVTQANASVLEKPEVSSSLRKSRPWRLAENVVHVVWLRLDLSSRCRRHLQ